MDDYLRLSRSTQWIGALLLAGTFLALVALLLDWARRLSEPALLLVPALFLMCPVASLALTPLYTLLGRYRYYAPMLFVIRGQGELHLHLGTLFDYLVFLRWDERGATAARKVMTSFLQGLIAIADDVEHGRIDGDLRLLGTSYVFGRRTIERLNFELRPPSPVVLAMMACNVLTIAACHLFVRGRPGVPNLLRVRKAEIRASALAAQKPRMCALLRQLQQQERPDGRAA